MFYLNLKSRKWERRGAGRSDPTETWNKSIGRRKKQQKNKLSSIPANVTGLAYLSSWFVCKELWQLEAVVGFQDSWTMWLSWKEGERVLEVGKLRYSFLLYAWQFNFQQKPRLTLDLILIESFSTTFHRSMTNDTTKKKTLHASGNILWDS